MSKDTLLFYDIEVFKHDALVIFKDINNNVVGKFWSTRGREFKEDPSGFEDVFDLIDGNTLVGYNNYHYDDIILTAMMGSATSLHLYEHNNTIINGSGSPLRRDPAITSLDTMQQLPNFPSLKVIEGNMGKSIVESLVAFRTDKPLTDEQREDTEKYCEYDIESTIEVYKLREKGYFDTKKSLVELLPKDTRKCAMRWNTTTISAAVLTGGSKSKEWNEDKAIKCLSGYWRNVDGIPDEVWGMWETSLKEENLARRGVSKSIRPFSSHRSPNKDLVMVFGLGGLHGAPSKPVRRGKVLYADVGSMYPSIIVKLGALDEATEIYNSIREERLRIKHTDKVKASAYKLILNSVYGNFKNKYSTLYNPRAGATVCIFGQIALFKLCAALDAAGYEIINANTDGVVFVEDDRLGDIYESGILEKWEHEFQPLILETDKYDEWIQKDVNNYIARRDDEIEVKGGEVNKYHRDEFFKNNDIRIVQIALVEKLLYNTDPLDTLQKHVHEPLLWQYVLKAGSTFAGTCDQNLVMQQKVNRVFACREGVPYVKLYKTRTGEDMINFPDAPERMYLWNRDVNELAETFPDIVDYDHYLNLVYKKLQGWQTCT